MKPSIQILRAARVLAVLLFTCISLMGTAAFAQSHNVVIIGGTTLDTGTTCSGSGAAANNMGFIFSGCLPVNGAPTELGAFLFSPLAPGAVSAASLAPFDTAVLNVASVAMACNTGTLTPAQKTDIVNFVGGGKKLIIFDSECPPQNYSWLPFPFTTANPGAAGAHGTLTILQNDTMVSNQPAAPNYIDVVHLGTQTDAVGDMNVMTTFDADWCVDMSGTNVVNATGPVHTYAKYPSLTDQGLIIYNGLDQNYQGYSLDDPYLRRIWLYELRQPFNPSLLPCGFTVVGITLTPETASNPIRTTHTVTASLYDLLSKPKVGVPVTFTIVSGPNMGAVGTCAPGNCATDANGQVNFTYLDNGIGGTDFIQASFFNQGVLVKSQEVTKVWVNPPPVAICADRTVQAGPACTANASINNGSYDPDAEPITLQQVPPGPYSLGTTSVMLTVSDAHGAASCRATVKVEDQTPPEVAVSTMQKLLWPPNHDLVDVGLAVTRKDNCTASTALTVAVYANEDDEMPTADGNFSPDAKLADSTNLRLRAERMGSGIGRVYLITAKAKDASGNVGFACTTVVVPQGNSPADRQAITAAAAGVQAYCAANNGTPPAGFFAVGDGPAIGPKQ